MIKNNLPSNKRRKASLTIVGQLPYQTLTLKLYCEICIASCVPELLKF